MNIPSKARVYVYYRSVGEFLNKLAEVGGASIATDYI